MEFRPLLVLFGQQGIGNGRFQFPEIDEQADDPVMRRGDRQVRETTREPVQ
jgi:hypothetical protein